MWITGYILGIIITILIWYLLLKLITNSDKKTFYFAEFLIYSFLTWVVIVTFEMFLMWWIWIKLNLINIIIWNTALIWILLWLNLFYKTKITFEDFKIFFSEFKKISTIFKLIIVIWTIWIIIKLSFWFISIVNVPTYQDDTFWNWNYRAKVWFNRQELVIDKKDKDFMWWWYKQYPITPSMYKTYLINFVWEWDEWLVNLPSFIYYICWIILLFFMIFRETKSLKFAFLWLYIISSVPLYYIHWTNPYFDVMQSIYFLITLYLLFSWYKNDNLQYLKLWLVFSGLSSFIKSEWLTIYLPLILWFFCVLLIIKNKNNTFSIIKKICLSFIIYLIPVIFTIFKLFNWLWFWNWSSNLSEFWVSFNKEALLSIVNNSLLRNGSFWIYFASFIFILLTYLVYRKKNYNKSILIFILFLLVLFIILGSLLVFINSLHIEAISQTWSNRVIIQLIPCFVFFEVIILKDLFN